MLMMRIAFAQGVQSPDTMTALLNEVHALCLAMEQQATIAPRIQLFMARLNIEEQRMEQLNQQSNQVKRELADAAQRVQDATASSADMEKQLRETQDEKAKVALTAEMEQWKREQQRRNATLQQLQVRDSDLARELGTEQARWGELNSRIDELEQTLAPVRKQQ
jgi:predicted  nucleic acid-binding Zn-ribbon protein